MIINPIIPIWLMTIICVISIVFIVYNKQSKDKILKRIDISIKICIVILIFIINLRFMIPNGESVAMGSNVNVLFVVDKTVSMKALDYDGEGKRIDGVINDCCYIVDKLSGCKFSIITFGDEAKRIIPFTDDISSVQAELKAITLEDSEVAQGSSINIAKDTLEEILKKEKERKGEDSKFVVFFVSDGEITKEGEKLDSFSSISQYVSDGAVLGYGTTNGGKMVSTKYENDNTSSSKLSEYYYVYYYEDDNYLNDKTIAISKLDENNLNKIASDLGVNYVHMEKTSNINSKISDVKKLVSKSQSNKEKITSYSDIYYYFAIPLIILLVADFVIQKRRM